MDHLVTPGTLLRDLSCQHHLMDQEEGGVEVVTRDHLGTVQDQAWVEV